MSEKFDARAYQIRLNKMTKSEAWREIELLRRQHAGRLSKICLGSEKCVEKGNEDIVDC